LEEREGELMKKEYLAIKAVEERRRAKVRLVNPNKVGCSCVKRVDLEVEWERSRALHGFR
jgi:hypothetical protein